MRTARLPNGLEESMVASLKPHPRNARVHSKKQIHQIAASIQEFGFTAPILIDQSNVIIAGHGRVAAAKLLGLATVPTIRIDHLSEAQSALTCSPTTSWLSMRAGTRKS